MLAMQPTPTADQILLYVTVAYFFVSTINIGVYLYTPELYPTRARALGVGTATAWLRFASMIGPTAVGFMIAGGLPSVFWMFACAALIAAVVTAAFAIETKGRVLEEVSP
jgi:putative MFS transporter